MPSSSSINFVTTSKMSASITSNDSMSTIILLYQGQPPLSSKILHLNTHLNQIAPRTTATCLYSATTCFHIQSDGQDDSPSSGPSSPGSQGHPPPIISSLPPTPYSWSPTCPTPGRLQRANSNPTIGTPLPPQTPLRRRSTHSPPPSRLQASPIQPLRRQGSGADLSPIDECRASECDGKRKVRLEREARELAYLRSQFLSDGSSDDEFEPRQEPVRKDRKESGGPRRQGGRTAKVKKHGVQNCLKLAKGKSYGRVFDDPFSAAVVLLVLPFLPPLGVYLTFRECGGMNRHRVRAVLVCVLLTALGWLPGIICEFLLSTPENGRVETEGGARLQG